MHDVLAHDALRLLGPMHGDHALSDLQIEIVPIHPEGREHRGRLDVCTRCFSRGSSRRKRCPRTQ
eukprot:13676959-Alexandrium_andersonii.AAC.1